MKRSMKVAFLLMVLLLLAAIAPTVAFASNKNEKADNIANECNFSFSDTNSKIRYLYDYNTVTSFDTSQYSGEQYLEIVFPTAKAVQGLYIRWNTLPGEWELSCDFGEGFVYCQDYGQNGFIQEYVELPENAQAARLALDSSSESVFSVIELGVYTKGELPDNVHIWQQTLNTVDFLIVSTHQDDEILFFGGAIPYYTGEKQVDTAVIYTAYENGRRLNEACDGLWLCGSRNYPIFLMLPDKYVKNIDDAKKYWDENELTQTLAEYILRLKPQVVLTQHTLGEYGHGQHRLTVESVKNAVENAADAAVVAASFPEYAPWNTPKLYLHGTTNDATLVMYWGNMPLSAFKGETALSIARRAYECHESQHYKGGFNMYYQTTEVMDCSLFLLHRSIVGDDTVKTDFFENVELRSDYAEIPAADAQYIAESGIYTEQTGKNLFRFEEDGETKYIRYCLSYGAAGWYRADSSGAITEPPEPIELRIKTEEIEPSQSDTAQQTQNESSPDIIHQYDLYTLIIILLLMVCLIFLAMMIIMFVRASRKKSRKR